MEDRRYVSFLLKMVALVFVVLVLLAAAEPVENKHLHPSSGLKGSVKRSSGDAVKTVFVPDSTIAPEVLSAPAPVTSGQSVSDVGSSVDFTAVPVAPVVSTPSETTGDLFATPADVLGFPLENLTDVPVDSVVATSLESTEIKEDFPSSSENTTALHEVLTLLDSSLENTTVSAAPVAFTPSEEETAESTPDDDLQEDFVTTPSSEKTTVPYSSSESTNDTWNAPEDVLQLLTAVFSLENITVAVTPSENLTESWITPAKMQEDFMPTPSENITVPVAPVAFTPSEEETAEWTTPDDDLQEDIATTPSHS
ncbi:flocculation protein FLO11-like [Denticeps clupeoides]|uniref:flocculation protein FLO11-like n=1 Tax=Denticeps clupeoides TaxID=299321 RepID=UPI0010A2C19A|nr:flocculation protein FLO11-like [Denticeps clupeoides]